MNRHLLHLGLGTALLLLMVLDLQLGSVSVPVWQGLSDWWQETVSPAALIVGEVRLPRVLLAALVGAILGLSGAAMQGLLRNPLAEPGLLGVSNCAALGTVLVLYLGLASSTPWLMPVAGMSGAALSVLLVLALAGRDSSATTLILAGVAVNAIASAMIAVTLNFAPNPFAIREIIFWLLGSVSNRSLQDVWLCLPFALAGSVLVLRGRHYLSALALGEESAQTLGFQRQRERLLLVIGIALMVGAAVSVCGTVGFVGLVIPHLLRPLVAHDPARLLICSALGGACLLVGADACVQLLSRGDELKLGVVTALIGGPFFLYLILKLRREWA